MVFVLLCGYTNDIHTPFVRGGGVYPRVSSKFGVRPPVLCDYTRRGIILSMGHATVC